MDNYFTDYEVYTEKQALKLVSKGWHEAYVTHVYTKTGTKDPSKTYVIVSLEVYENGNVHIINQGCYFSHMLRHLCEATGNLDKYESKTLKLDDLKHKEVRVYVRIDEAKDGFKAKNSISDFMKSEKQVTNEKPFVDDDIGF